MGRVNVALALSSLVLSFILWSVVFSQNVKNQLRVFPVPLEISALDSKFAIVKMPEEVSVSVTTTEERLKKLANTKLTAFVDLSRAAVGIRSYPVKVFPILFQETVGDQALTARIEIEQISERKLPVTIDTAGDLQDMALKVESIFSDPAVVKIYGPRSEINKAQLVRGLLNLDQVFPGANRTYSVYLEAIGPNSRPLPNVKTEPLFARISLTLGAAPEEKRVIIVPTLDGQPASGFSVTNTRVEPTQITLRGNSMALARMSRVFTNSINLKDLKADKTIMLSLKLPGGTRAVGPAQVKVTVEIRPISDLSRPTPSNSSQSTSDPTGTEGPQIP